MEKKDKKKNKGKGKAVASDDSDFYAGVASGSGSGTESDTGSAVDDPLKNLEGPSDGKHKRKRTGDSPGHAGPLPLPRASRRSPVPNVCGLCSTVHDDGECYMTESPENLAEYRRILISHAGEESIEERVRVIVYIQSSPTDLIPLGNTQRAAIAIIDETLHRLGKMHLIYGQPLHLVDISDYPPALQRPNATSSAGVPASFIQSVQKSKKAAVKSGPSKPPKPAKPPAPKPYKPPTHSSTVLNGVASSSKLVSSAVAGPSKASNSALFTTAPRPRQSLPAIVPPSVPGLSSIPLHAGTSIVPYPMIDTYVARLPQATAINANGVPGSSADKGISSAAKASTSAKNTNVGKASKNAVAGPSNSKRARSPPPANISKTKKLKPTGLVDCPVCNGASHASMAQCPLILLGNAEKYVSHYYPQIYGPLCVNTNSNPSGRNWRSSDWERTLPMFPLFRIYTTSIRYRRNRKRQPSHDFNSQGTFLGGVFIRV